MKKKLSFLLYPLLFLLLTIIIFKPYFFNHQVPFAGNLLVSFYQPYKSYSWPGYPNGPANKPIGFDSLRIYYPLRQLTIESFRGFSWPLWNPYDFSGNTQMATYQSAIFHPLSFLFFLLPQIDAWSVIVILAPFLGMLFMYLFLRELDLSRKASAFGAVGFGLSGFVLANTEELFLGLYSALLLPLLLYGICKLYKKASALSFTCITLATAFSILSGWFQMTLYSMLFAFVYSLFLYFKTKKRSAFLLTLAGFILGIFISAIHLLPSFEAYFYSARGTTDARFLFNTYLVPWYHLITYIAPDYFGNPGSYNYFGKGFYFEKMLYVGLPILLFGIYSILADIRKKAEVGFFTVLWIVTLSLGFSLPTSWFLLYQLHLPFVATMLPARIFFLSTICISILAAYGVDAYLKKISCWRLLLAVGIIGLILMGGWLYIAYVKLYVVKRSVHPFLLIGMLKMLAISQRNLLLPTAIYIVGFMSVIAASFKKLNKIMYFTFFLILLAGSIYFAKKYFYFSDRQFTFPQVPVLQKLEEVAGDNRVWSFGPAAIERNFLTYYHLQSPEGYDSLSVQRYIQLLYASVKGGKYLPQEISRADAELLSASNTSEVISNPLRIKLLSLLGVKYIVGANTVRSNNTKDHSILSPIWQDKNFIIYQNEKAYPRAFLVDDYKVTKDNQEMLNLMFSPRVDLSKTVILETPPVMTRTNVPLQGDATIVSYTPNKVIINATVNKPALLFLSDNFYPGWQAFVDGKQTPLYQADFSFRSLVVTPGKHVVTFIYKPFTFLLGLIISCVSIVLLLSICLLFRFTKKGNSYVKHS